MRAHSDEIRPELRLVADDAAHRLAVVGDQADGESEHGGAALRGHVRPRGTGWEVGAVQGGLHHRKRDLRQGPHKRHALVTCGAPAMAVADPLLRRRAPLLGLLYGHALNAGVLHLLHLFAAGRPEEVKREKHQLLEHRDPLLGFGARAAAELLKLHLSRRPRVQRHGARDLPQVCEAYPLPVGVGEFFRPVEHDGAFLDDRRGHAHNRPPVAEAALEQRPRGGGARGLRRREAGEELGDLDSCRRSGPPPFEDESLPRHIARCRYLLLGFALPLGGLRHSPDLVVFFQPRSDPAGDLPQGDAAAATVEVDKELCGGGLHGSSGGVRAGACSGTLHALHSEAGTRQHRKFHEALVCHRVNVVMLARVP
mmetsp:Transcript_133745/g.333772  ORF Transcript_133745/g.333772 Transcript_133745/m.333772 type:complete len:368 (+) Transcript_133745:1489-2592(+)